MAASEPEFVINEVMSDAATSVLELDGTVRRSSANILATTLTGGPVGGVVAIDLSLITVPNHWLLAALAKAHAVLRARRGSMLLVVNDDAVLDLLHGSSFDRLVSIVLTRQFGSCLNARATHRRSVQHDRQRVIDLTSRVRSRAHIGSVARSG